jgi:hypothetical protein
VYLLRRAFKRAETLAASEWSPAMSYVRSFFVHIPDSFPSMASKTAFLSVDILTDRCTFFISAGAINNFSRFEAISAKKIFEISEAARFRTICPLVCH